MTTHSHEHEPAEAPELSGVVLLLLLVTLSGVLVWLCT